MPIMAILPRRPKTVKLLIEEESCPLPPSITINCGSGSPSLKSLLYLLKTTSSIEAKSSGPSTVFILK